MDSFLYAYTCELENKWHEIDLLIEKAYEFQETDAQFHNILCRSASVLITAQLEGFTKSMLRSVINDLNRSISFNELPIAIKRTYSQKYIPIVDGLNNKQHSNQLNKLIEKFNEINCDLEHQPFFVSKNKNPSPNLINTVYRNLGIKDIFHCLNESKYDEVFSSSKNELEIILRELRELIPLEIKNFPYTPHLDNCNLEVLKSHGRTLWEDFLDEINQRRHAIAHGNDFNNNRSVSELEEDKLKAQIFELSCLRILSKYLISNRS
ncbi:HEPN domain-containing protein [Maribacter sp. BPC-D8]|uniref:HEPN domain-containing protein n=1 Tax=Maribacter sp. BPC-D8 TaxID=3053613 RepID=UPI002B49AD7A|nr:HEPN domain-containing protein [Maribacter sp. BPC-D8]WRI30970.1 HEPN domain-containing protein [Maribacter sp. BPC-D8]